MPRSKSTYSFLENALEAAEEKFGRKVTQVQLAALLGISQPSVSEWRQNRAKIEHAQMLALKLGHCVEWLYNRTGPRHPWDAQVTGDPKLKELMSIWNQLSDEGKSRLLGAGVTLLQDFRETLPEDPPSPRQHSESSETPSKYDASGPEKD